MFPVPLALHLAAALGRARPAPPAGSSFASRRPIAAILIQSVCFAVCLFVLLFSPVRRRRPRLGQLHAVWSTSAGARGSSAARSLPVARRARGRQSNHRAIAGKERASRPQPEPPETAAAFKHIASTPMHSLRASRRSLRSFSPLVRRASTGFAAHHKLSKLASLAFFLQTALPLSTRQAPTILRAVLTGRRFSSTTSRTSLRGRPRPPPTGRRIATHRPTLNPAGRLRLRFRNNLNSPASPAPLWSIGRHNLFNLLYTIIVHQIRLHPAATCSIFCKETGPVLWGSDSSPESTRKRRLCLSLSLSTSLPHSSRALVHSIPHPHHLRTHRAAIQPDTFIHVFTPE